MIAVCCFGWLVSLCFDVVALLLGCLVLLVWFGLMCCL